MLKKNTIKDKLYEFIMKNTLSSKQSSQVKTFTTESLAEVFHVQRSNLSAHLNTLVRENKLEKIAGRPVRYCLKQAVNTSCFDQLIGAETSLKSSIEIAKAILLYPEKGMNIILVGESGTGKSVFATMLYRYAIEQNILSQQAPFLKLNIKHFKDDSLELEKIFMLDPTSGKNQLSSAQNGIIFIEHIDLLPTHIHDHLIRLIEQNYFKQNGIILVGAMNATGRKERLESLLARSSLRIDIPPLKGRSMQERYQFVKTFIAQEQSNMGKKVKIDAELFHCLLVYPCKNNVYQLKQDIRLACAKAYARELSHEDAPVLLEFSDFPIYVKEGLFFMEKNIEEIHMFVPKQHVFTFEDGKVIRGYNEYYVEDDITPIYELIERKAAQLEKRGIAEADIIQLLFAEVESRIHQLQFQEERGHISRENLAKIVDPTILKIAGDYLDGATDRFKRVYSESLYHGLCLHLSALLERHHSSKKYSLAQIKGISEKYREEYGYAVNFASEIESLFDLTLSVDEVIFLTLFLVEVPNNSVDSQNKTNIIIAMHGETTASSLVDVVKIMTLNDNVYAFDMPLTMKIEEAYSLLSERIQSLYNGHAILMLYDMGSFKSMAKMIAEQSDIPITLLELPYTMVALDLARKALTLPDAQSVHDSVVKNFKKHYSDMYASYKHEMRERIIVTLCMSGEGAAVKIQKYIEKHLEHKQINIVPLAVTNHTEFIYAINQLRKDHTIIAIVGTYNPDIYGIPFISLSQLFATPSDALDVLMALETEEYPKIESVSVAEMIDSMGDYLINLDLEKLKRTLPKAIDKMTKGHSISQDQILGLSLHVASYIDRLKSGQYNKTKATDTYLLQEESRWVKIVKEALEEVETEFFVEFEENELINIMKILQEK